MNDTITPSSSADVDSLRAAMSADLMQPASLERYFSLYANDMEFTDPLVDVRGREAFERSMRRFVNRARELQVEVRQSAQQGNQLYLTWAMTFVPRPIGPRLRIEGVTHAVVRDGKITAQRDYWDLLGTVMDAIPLARQAYRSAVALFA